MCVDALVGMIAKIKCLGNNDREVLRNLKQFQNYMQSVPVFSMRTIISELKFSDSLKVVLLLLPFQVENKRIHLDTMYTKQCDSNYHEILRWLTNDQFIEKENLCEVVELECFLGFSKNRDFGFTSYLPNLKVVKFVLYGNDESLKQLAEVCPLLEVLECSTSSVTDTGLEYLCSLINLKSVKFGVAKITPVGVVRFLKKCEIQEFRCLRVNLTKAIDILFSQNDVIPSIKSLSRIDVRILSKVMQVFPNVDNLIVKILNLTTFSLQCLSENTKIKVLSIEIFYCSDLSCLDVNILLKSFQNIFSGMMSFSLGIEPECYCSCIDVTPEMPLIPFFINVKPEMPLVPSSVTRLAVLGVDCANLFSLFMVPNNNIKVLVLDSLRLFVDFRYKSCLNNLENVEVIEVDEILEDFSLIDRILKFLPSLRVFKCLWSNQKDFEKLRLNYMSNNHSKVKFMVTRFRF